MRRVTAALTLTGLLLVFGGPLLPASAQETSGAKEASVFRVGMRQSFVPTNPMVVNGASDLQMIGLQYDMLTQYEEDGQPAPGLATGWTVSEDRLTWTFTIRDSALWQDGEPVTANDVDFTFNYMKGSFDYEDGAFAFFYYSNYLAGIKSVEATDSATVVFTTEQPQVWLDRMWIPILPQHIWKDVSYEAASGGTQDIEGFNGPFVGSGPFQLVDFERDQFARFKANADYWAGAPQIDEMVVQYFQTPDAAVQALKSGEIDLLDDVPAERVSELEQTSGISVVRSPDTGFTELGMNSWVPVAGQFRADESEGSLGNPWLTRADVRDALAHSIDKQALVEQALLGFGSPGSSFIADAPPYTQYAASPASPRSFDPNETRSRLEALGFRDTDGNGILNAPDDTQFDSKGAGKDFVLRLYVIRTHDTDKVAGKLIQQWMRQAGVGIDYSEVEEFPFLLNHVFPFGTNADADLYIWNWFAPDPDPYYITSIFTTDQINGLNDSNYSNPEYDQLFNESASEFDPAKRVGVIQQMQALIERDVPYDVLWNAEFVQAYRSDKWEGLNQWPLEGRAWYPRFGQGTHGSLLTVRPLTASSSSSNTPFLIFAAGATAIALTAAFAFKRRRNE